jgi:GMP synthase-like glutamine amidotransferase
MVDRILRVNAYTTFDLLEGTVEGHGFEEDAYAVLNVKTARKDPENVELQVELDNTEIDAVPAHADKVTLSPAEARELAAELESAAETVERAQES